MKKKRIDQILVDRGLAPSRTKAQAMVMAGEVFIPSGKITRPSAQVPVDIEIVVKPLSDRWVSRGALKLLGAIEDLNVDVAGLTAVDVGSSTGGFTEVLLKKGAKKVFAVDVNVQQLHERLKNDPRVIPIKLNARYLEPAKLNGELVDIAVIDCSFISLTLLLKPVTTVVREHGLILAMIKPQFELQPKALKKGIVRDEASRQAAIHKVIDYAQQEVGLIFLGGKDSQVAGPKGNREHFVLFRVPSRTLEEEAC